MDGFIFGGWGGRIISSITHFQMLSKFFLYVHRENVIQAAEPTGPWIIE